MATLITLGIDGQTRDGNTKILVKENFDEVMEKYWPTQPASSQLEGRMNAIFTLSSTEERILIKTPSIILIEENGELED